MLNKVYILHTDTHEPQYLGAFPTATLCHEIQRAIGYGKPAPVPYYQTAAEFIEKSGHPSAKRMAALAKLTKEDKQALGLEPI